jgi:hypothetical protein
MGNMMMMMNVCSQHCSADFVPLLLLQLLLLQLLLLQLLLLTIGAVHYVLSSASSRAEQRVVTALHPYLYCC